MLLSPIKLSLLLLLFVANVSSLKFLFYNPLFGKSHVIYVGKLADTLAKAGHDVVNYQPVASNDFNDTGVKLARTIRREADFNLTLDVNMFAGNMWKGVDMWKMIESINTMVGFFATSCEHQLKDEKLMEQLRNEKFDFAFTEFFDKCGLAIFEKIGVKRYGAMILAPLNGIMTSALGIPSTLSYVPEMTTGSLPPFGFVDRIKNVIMDAVFKCVFIPKMVGPLNLLAKKYIREDFDVEVRLQEASLVFVNVDEFLDFPRPISHKIHYIGGIGMGKPEKLSPDFEKLMTSSKRGVVYMSFGTVTKSVVMPNKTKKAFLEAFSEFPDVTFLWKYEVEDGVAKDYNNVITRPWFPQKDLLVHPNLLAFITHGGANSIIESATAGSPVISIPVFGDQSRNSLMTEFRGYGIKLDLSQLTKEKIVDALHKIIEDKSYKKNANELSQLIKSKPHSADEIFIKYSEFAARFDLHEKLDLQGRKMNFFHFYNLDVFAFIFSAISVVLLILFVVSRFVVRRLLRLCKKQKVE